MHRRDPCLLACVNISRAPKAMDLSRHRTGALTSLSISQSKCVCVCALWINVFVVRSAWGSTCGVASASHRRSVGERSGCVYCSVTDEVCVA